MISGQRRPAGAWGAEADGRGRVRVLAERRKAGGRERTRGGGPAGYLSWGGGGATRGRKGRGGYGTGDPGAGERRW